MKTFAAVFVPLMVVSGSGYILKGRADSEKQAQMAQEQQAQWTQAVKQQSLQRGDLFLRTAITGYIYNRAEWDNPSYFDADLESLEIEYWNAMGLNKDGLWVLYCYGNYLAPHTEWLEDISYGKSYVVTDNETGHSITVKEKIDNSRFITVYETVKFEAKVLYWYSHFPINGDFVGEVNAYANELHKSVMAYRVYYREG